MFCKNLCLFSNANSFIFYYTFIVTNALQREEIDKLRRKLKESHNGLIESGNQNGSDSNSQRQCSSIYVNNPSSNTYSRLLYVKVSICPVYYSLFYFSFMLTAAVNKP